MYYILFYIPFGAACIPPWTHHISSNAYSAASGYAINLECTDQDDLPQEAYELLHSLIDKEGIDDREREKVSQQLKKILGSFKGLNEIGRKKAVERIEELYMIPKYIFDNFPDKID